jgi:hypothetical protein
MMRCEMTQMLGSAIYKYARLCTRTYIQVDSKRFSKKSDFLAKHLGVPESILDMKSILFRAKMIEVYAVEYEFFVEARNEIKDCHIGNKKPLEDEVDNACCEACNEFKPELFEKIELIIEQFSGRIEKLR